MCGHSSEEFGLHLAQLDDICRLAFTRRLTRELVEAS
jgi:hypothetical protein